MENLKIMNREKKNIPIETIISLHNDGLYDREIAELLGCTRHNITARLNKSGISGRKSKIENIDVRNRISNALIGRYYGGNNPNFDGYKNIKRAARGILKTVAHRVIRNSDHVCQLCNQSSNSLEIHHIVPFKEIMDNFLQDVYDGNRETLYEQLTTYPPFMDENNLMILCEECHKKVHSKDNHEPSLLMQEGATTISKESRVQAFGARNAGGLYQQMEIVI